MAKVYDVAEFFIQLASSGEDDQITNLKLNKLLYYAQGAYLARTGKTLFSNAIEAWQLGPVVADVYHRYKVCGRNPISPSSDNLELSCFSEDELETMYDVMRELGCYTGAKLVTLTHKDGTPWSVARERGEAQLDAASMRQYFIKHPVPRLCDRITTPVVSSLPADWCDESEDAEWEGYL